MLGRDLGYDTVRKKDVIDIETFEHRRHDRCPVPRSLVKTPRDLRRSDIDGKNIVQLIVLVAGGRGSANGRQRAWRQHRYQMFKRPLQASAKGVGAGVIVMYPLAESLHRCLPLKNPLFAP